MIGVERPKLAAGAPPEIKQLHNLLCQAQVDWLQMQTFKKNKEMMRRASRDFAVIFPELLRTHAKCLEIYQRKTGRDLFTAQDEPQFSSQEFIRFALRMMFGIKE